MFEVLENLILKSKAIGIKLHSKFQKTIDEQTWKLSETRKEGQCMKKICLIMMCTFCFDKYLVLQILGRMT